MSPDQLTTVSRVAHAIQIQEIRPVLMHAQLHPVAAPEQANLNIQTQLHTRRDAGFLQVLFQYQINGLNDAKQEFVSLSYHLQLSYALRQQSFSDEELRLFAEKNAPLHAWPYLRAYVQNAFAQLQLPQVILPPVLITPPQPTEKRTAVAK